MAMLVLQTDEHKDKSTTQLRMAEYKARSKLYARCHHGALYQPNFPDCEY